MPGPSHNTTLCRLDGSEGHGQQGVPLAATVCHTASIFVITLVGMGTN